MTQNTTKNIKLLRDIAKCAILSLTEEELKNILFILESERKEGKENGKQRKEAL